MLEDQQSTQFLVHSETVLGMSSGCCLSSEKMTLKKPGRAKSGDYYLMHIVCSYFYLPASIFNNSSLLNLDIESLIRTGKITKSPPIF